MIIIDIRLVITNVYPVITTDAPLMGLNNPGISLKKIKINPDKPNKANVIRNGTAVNIEFLGIKANEASDNNVQIISTP